MSAPVTVLIDGTVAVVTVTNPPVNAIDDAVLEGLGAAAEQLAGDRAVRAVVLTGAGDKAFMAGADLNAFKEMLDGASSIDHHTALTRRVFGAWESLPQPTVAAIQASAVGGGLEAAAGRARLRADARFRVLAGQLESLSPLAVLGRGYAVCWTADRTAVLRSAAAVAPGDRVRVTGEVTDRGGRSVLRVRSLRPAEAADADWPRALRLFGALAVVTSGLARVRRINLGATLRAVAPVLAAATFTLGATAVVAKLHQVPALASVVPRVFRPRTCQ